jgi:hypothetical protein
VSELFDDTLLQSEVPQDVVISDEGPFVIIPSALISEYGEQLGACGIAVYVGLKSHANRQQGMSTFILTETLAKELNMGESTVRRELTNLSNLGLITKTRRFARSSVYRVLPIRYMVADSPLLGSGQCAIRERYNHKNYNQKNITKESASLYDLKPIREVFDYYLALMFKNPKLYTLTPPRIEKLKSRFSECLLKTENDTPRAIELMKTAIDNCANSEFHMGKNERGKKYNDLISNIFKSYEQMEKWWND